MLGNSYPTGNPLSQNHVQAVNNLNSMGMMNDVNSNDAAPFDINDFPQLSSRPNSAGGPQGQLGNLIAYIYFFQKFFLWPFAVTFTVFELDNFRFIEKTGSWC